ncbi:MAG: TIR domain-containing protein, partial [Mucilaginibacter sp.]|uniref:toll/interleukin-1 receptor domain-containing protein n=1 Tax=Mucilaginibacter sp. TaxID=1882438 RepID=UPI003265245B
MIITGSKELMAHMQGNFPKRLQGYNAEHDVQPHIIYKKVFKGYTFNGNFGALFKNCKFIDCHFENVFGFFFLFNDCKFEKCSFINSRFSHFEEEWTGLEFHKCHFKSVQLDEGTFFNVFFYDCNFEMFHMIDFYSIDNAWFTNCYIQSSQFQSLNYYNNEVFTGFEYPDLCFENCTVDGSGFSNTDLRSSIFRNTILYDTSFVNCRLNENTIEKTEKLKFESKATVDLQTIIKSEDLNFNILKEYFNINDPNIKDVISKITSKVEFKNVFISFSFKDKKFAERLHKELTAKGIRSFFWMKDAPPGELLENIMSSGIKSHDKILFVASKDSIKSPACQFELSEGRRKQNETWESVLFPIHIDDFLFTVAKNQIRPIEKADEYWENIEELKRINSTDFSEFNQDRIT